MEVAAMKSFSINEWCGLHGVSPSLFFKLLAKGEAPRTYKIGRRTLITEAAAAEWLAARQALAA
jgi:predicted DNA-binding transcriptional regulator AlpA